MSIDEYNESIGTVADCYIAKPEDAERLKELSERAHQFNLSDRHYSLSEVEERISSKDYTVFTLSAKDVYGDMGIVRLAVLSQNTIESFMISCRVFERNFEELLLDKIRQEVPCALRGVVKDNGKNARFKDFFNNHGIKTV